MRYCLQNIIHTQTHAHAHAHAHTHTHARTHAHACTSQEIIGLVILTSQRDNMAAKFNGNWAIMEVGA